MIEPGAFRQREPWTVGSGMVGPTRVFHHIQCGAELLGGDDAVAGVGRCADRPVRGDRCPLILDSHLLVALEATAGQNHASASPDQLGLRTFRSEGVPNVDAPHDIVLDM